MKIVAVTSCPTGIAHTYMAAEALSMTAQEMGIEIKVETQGSVGAENVITEEELKEASAVILACDTKVDKSRFIGLPMVEVSVKDAIKDPKGLIERALNAEPPKEEVVEKVQEAEEEKEKISGAKTIYKHLMTGVSYMIPFTVAGGLLIAFSFAFGITAYEQEGSLAAALHTIGSKGAMTFMIPVLAGFISFSISDRPGLVPGFVGGFLANYMGAGFLGGLVAGFLAGYVVVLIKKVIRLPKSLEGLMPVLVIPVLSTLIVGLIMFYIIGGPVTALNVGLTNWLNSLTGANGVLLGAILGAMMASDMGGPLNKAAYTFGAATITAGGSSAVMAAVMAGGMVPPLAVAFATTISKKGFTNQEREAGKVAWALGAAFITEGAIPFASADPVRVIPSLAIGSAITGALSMLFGCALAVPHGGIFVLPIPNAVTNVLWYILSIIIGTLVGGFILAALKKTINK